MYAESSLLLGQRGDELAAEVRDVGHDAAPDEVGTSSNDDNLRDILEDYSHVIPGLGEVAASAMADALEE